MQRADYALAQIQLLYDVERKADDERLTYEQRAELRTHASHACNTSSILVSTTVKFVYALLAQLVEQLTLNSGPMEKRTC